MMNKLDFSFKDTSWIRNINQNLIYWKLHLFGFKKQLLLCMFLFSVAIWFLLENEIASFYHFIIPRNFDLRFEQNVVSGPGCHIPLFDEYDLTILEALNETILPLNCDKKSTGILVKSNLTHLYLDQTVVSKHYQNKNLHCCYRPFWKSSAEKSGYRYFNRCISITSEVFATFVRVECIINNDLVNKDFYSFVPKYYRYRGKNAIPMKNVSVLVLGIDAVSRLNFRRQMKDTYSFLIETIGAVEFLGYNKVADNTFPNLMPVLSGKSEHELTKTCWPDDSYTFDRCSFVWDYFKKAGYVTGFGEDASWMGIFQYCKRGFNRKPTDIYLRVFNRAYENELGHERRLNAYICVGPKLNIELLLDSVKKFVLLLEGKLSFGFFWENSLTHDYLNLPKYGDSIYKTLLEELLKKRIFETTVVFVMSDHGIRWGTIRSTYQGYMEERLPLLIVSSPRWFRQKFQLAWANLKKNRLRLTTPYDLHETLKDLKNLTRLEDDVVNERSKSIGKGNKKLPRGISLFLPIPPERTCRDAGIDEHWCTCHKDVNTSTSSPQVKNGASFIIERINSYLKGYSQCNRLTVSSILRAFQKELPVPTGKSITHQNLKHYTIIVKAEPGAGIFEASIQYDSGTGEYSLMGSISRSNTYGNSSYCVSHYKLKLFCHCK